MFDPEQVLSGAQTVSRRALLDAGANEKECANILRELLPVHAGPESVVSVWQRVSKHGLSPDMPFAVHKLVSAAVFGNWDEAALGPPPLWFPSAPHLTNLARFMRSHPDLLGPPRVALARESCAALAADAARLHATSVDAPERFWPPVLRQLGLEWDTPPRAVLEISGDVAAASDGGRASASPGGAAAADPDACRWFPGARLNIAKVALWDRDPDAAAIVHASEDSPRRPQTVTYDQLRRRALAVARSLRALGLAPGDAVAVVMTMTPAAVAAYLGIVLMGGAVVSVAESFSTEEMASRLAIAGAKLVLTQDVVKRGGKEHPLYSRVASLPHPRPRAVVLAASGAGTAPQHPLDAEDMPWEAFLSLGAGIADFEPYVADPYHVCNVLFSSGTTGEPKAIPWTHLTPLRAGVDAWACQDLRLGDVVLWPTSLGWMMGPWLLFATLLNGCAMALFAGSPTERAFGEFVESARVSVVGLVPSIAKAWRASDCMRGLDWSCVRCFSSSGEASAPDDAHWLMARAGYKPIIEYCGGTEIGGAFCSATLLHPAVPSAFSTLTLGMDLLVSPTPALESESSATPRLVPMRLRAAVRGEVMLRAPALGMSQALLNRDHGGVYYGGMPALEHPGLGGAALPLRRHGDEFEVMPGGFYRALGRCDDTMNLGGVKVSSVELERVCVKHVEGVVQAAAVAVPSPGGGPEQLVLFVVLRVGAVNVAAPELQALASRCQQAIRRHLNPLFKVQAVVVRRDLPVNASNKVMRRVLRDQLQRAQGRASKL